MTLGSLTPVSIRITEGTATVECETCGRNLDVATKDRSSMVQNVRAFLDTHGRCRADVLPGCAQA